MPLPSCVIHCEQGFEPTNREPRLCWARNDFSIQVLVAWLSNATFHLLRLQSVSGTTVIRRHRRSLDATFAREFSSEDVGFIEYPVSECGYMR